MYHHPRLLKKLHAMGIQDSALNILRSFLENRLHRTKVGNCTSSTQACELGVPQGLILGLILFVIYINDLEHSINHSKLYMYADDTAITYSGTNIVDVKNKIQGDINSLCKWMDTNQLTINTGLPKKLNS